MCGLFQCHLHQKSTWSENQNWPVSDLQPELIDIVWLCCHIWLKLSEVRTFSPTTSWVPGMGGGLWQVVLGRQTTTCRSPLYSTTLLHYHHWNIVRSHPVLMSEICIALLLPKGLTLDYCVTSIQHEIIACVCIQGKNNVEYRLWGVAQLPGNLYEQGSGNGKTRESPR